MFKKNNYFLLIAFIFLIALILLSFNKKDFYPRQESVPDTINQEEISLEFLFDKDEVIKLKYPYSSQAERTLNVLFLTEKLAQDQGWEFQSQDYGEMGNLITQIRNKTNGEGNNYWHYYINDVLAPVAADQYILQPGDIVSWSFQDSQKTTKY